MHILQCNRQQNEACLWAPLPQSGNSGDFYIILFQGELKMKRKDVSTELKRVALYIRVSGEEQKIHGLSLEAQQERLETYAR